MQPSRKRVIPGLLLCSLLVLLPLQVVSQANSIANSLPVAGGPMSNEQVNNRLVIPPISCSKPSQQPKPQPAGTAVAQLATQWLNQWGQAEIVLADRLSGPDLGSGHLALLLPLCEQSPQLLLTQWGLRRDHQQTTLNVGLGQRWFNQAQGYWGYHLFYDYRRQGDHGRLGLGLEQRSATRTVAVNGYLPVSGWRIAEDQATQSRPAKGIDLRLQQQLPQHPQLQLSAVLEHYFAQTLATAKTQPPLRPTAFTLGIEYTPLPLLTASYGYQLASGGARHHQLQLNLTYRLGMPLAPQLDPKQVAQSQTLASSRYALIRRNSQIVLEQRAYKPPAKVVKADHAQAPQDTLQIALPNEQQQGEPGQSLTVPIKLSSSCALTDWQFTGEGNLITLGGTLQQVDVDPEKQQAILTLPEQSGDYSLEIVASKAQGVTTRSNTLKVQVREAAAVSTPQAQSTPRQVPATAISSNPVKQTPAHEVDTPTLLGNRVLVSRPERDEPTAQSPDAHQEESGFSNTSEPLPPIQPFSLDTPIRTFSQYSRTGFRAQQRPENSSSQLMRCSELEKHKVQVREAAAVSTPQAQSTPRQVPATAVSSNPVKQTPAHEVDTPTLLGNRVLVSRPERDEPTAQSPDAHQEESGLTENSSPQLMRCSELEKYLEDWRVNQDPDEMCEIFETPQFKKKIDAQCEPVNSYRIDNPNNSQINSDYHQKDRESSDNHSMLSPINTTPINKKKTIHSVKKNIPLEPSTYSKKNRRRSMLRTTTEDEKRLKIRNGGDRKIPSSRRHIGKNNTKIISTLREKGLKIDLLKGLDNTPKKTT